MALADVNDASGELVWDLSPVGILMDNCTYSVSFIVWPDQDAYDYVAGLNNGLAGYTWSKRASTYEDLTSTKGYEKGGVERFPSIVKKTNGTFAVLTNTDQKLHYSVIETTSDGTNTNTTVTGPFYHQLETPDPMPLTAAESQIEKQWNIGMNPGTLAQLLYILNPHYTLTFNILQDTNTAPYTTVQLGWSESEHRYVWDESSEQTVVYKGKEYVVGTRWADDFAIATGLMLSEARMDALGMDKVKYGPPYRYGSTNYYILETGHDYTIEEIIPEDAPRNAYEFDFDAPVYHPMLVDGKLKSVTFNRDEENNAIISIKEIRMFISL